MDVKKQDLERGGVKLIWMVDRYPGIVTPVKYFSQYKDDFLWNTVKVEKYTKYPDIMDMHEC